MKIYKFKELVNEQNHSHSFQIIKENRVWCSEPGSLNDDAEFSFGLDYSPTLETAILLKKLIEKMGSNRFPSHLVADHAISSGNLEEIAKPSIDEAIEKCRSSIGITSFSTVRSGNWLWKNYGGSGNGIIIEFELPESRIGESFHPIEYVNQRVFHIDIFLKSQVQGDPEIYRKILCTKRFKWCKEKEIRFLGKTQNVPIKFDLNITKVIIGKLVKKPVITEIVDCCKERGINIEYL
jgi:hypothetical protein